MEYIHGENGNAILIRRELVADLPVHSDSQLHFYFEHFYWHELGHCYAINAETNNLHRYNEPDLVDTRIYMMQRLMAADTAVNVKSRKVTGSGRSL